MKIRKRSERLNSGRSTSSHARLWRAMLVVTCLLLVAAGIVFSPKFADAQQNVWSANTDNRASITTHKAVARHSFPTDFKLFNLNIEPLRQQLFSIVDSNNRQQSTVISLPNAAGGIEQFEVFEASNFEPELQAQFPQIRAYSGKGVTDKYATLKLSISPQGIQTMVFRTNTENEFIEPYSQDATVYAVFRSQRAKGELPWECSTEDKNLMADVNSQLPETAGQPDSNTGEAKTMRLAQSCNAEYSNFFGASNSGQVAFVLAAFNATLTRTNGAYEKDLGLHLNLIANTTAVIFYDPLTDPYTTLGQWNNQLQATLTANIGEANYDIGHMFGASGGGGNAGCIGCVCVDGQKGRGITSPADGIPMGDNFDIDYVAHEVGHQLGANHSFSFQLEGTGQNKEVGSGITVMGYAGITNQDVAPHSIDIFHETSIQQIQVNLATKACPVTTVMTANHPPVVAAVSNYTIPISTPFALTGSATDPEGDALTYNWEQNDNSTTSGANSVASPTKATGPNWLTFPSTSSGTRTFPRLSTILAGQFVTGPLPGGSAGANIEALSSVSRTLNFRLTVRDNRPYVPASTIGQTQFTDMTVTVTNTSGPFKVTSPNTNINVPGGSNHNVTWDVAGTTGAPVSAANVKISLSTDGGQTFPTVLSASTANDGSESLPIPNTASTTARIKVEAVGNIFFDISDVNFTITPGVVTQRATRDFDGDNKTDYSVFRPSSNTWFIRHSSSGALQATQFGLNTDALVQADYDGDNKADVAVFRPSNGTWYILQSSNGAFVATQFGLNGDVPVPADYDGDNKADVAVFRPSSGTWYILQSQLGFRAEAFGSNGDKAVPADYDGDNKADIAVYRGGTWYIQQSTAGFRAQSFGTDTDRVVPGDYDGDGKTDLAVFRPSQNVWYILRSMTGNLLAQFFGTQGDTLVQGDYDGDGKTDIAVWRPSNGVYYTVESSGQPRATAPEAINGSFPWGLSGDRALAYVPEHFN